MLKQIPLENTRALLFNQVTNLLQIPLHPDSLQEAGRDCPD